MRLRCPYCHKVIYEHEKYCRHCDEDVSKVLNRKERPRLRK